MGVARRLCCIQICVITRCSILKTVHSDSATMKMVFPSTSQAMGMLIPIYKLHITNTLPTSALCDSIVYGMVRTAIIQLFHACLSKLLPRGALDDLMHYCTRPSAIVHQVVVHGTEG